MSTKVVTSASFAAMLAMLLAWGQTAGAGDAKTGLGSSQQPVIVALAVNKIVVDGESADWSTIKALPAPFSSKETGSLKLAWREDGLYGCVEVKDAVIRADEKKPWSGDCIELWLGLDNVCGEAMCGSDCQIVLAPNPTASAGACCIKTPTGSIETNDVTAAWKAAEGGYRLEFRISAKGMLPAPMAEGAKVGFNYAINDKGHPVEQFFCDKNADNAYSKPNAWGVIQLGNAIGVVSAIAAAAPVAPAKPVSVSTDPNKPAWASATGTDDYGVWADLTVGKVKQRFRLIKPGTFIMGSPQSEKDVALASDPGCKQADVASEVQHEVTLSQGYWLADTPCTEGLRRTLIGDPIACHRDPLVPAEMVSWVESQEIIRKLNRQVAGLCARLPTEAEWEYACRAGTKTAFSFGDAISNQKDQVNYEGSAFGIKEIKRAKHSYYLWKVKLLPPNAWGLYEMHGNIREWCGDWYGDYAVGPQRDPSGPATGTFRVLRGGCWFDSAWRCRSACRERNPPDVRLSGNGFRLVVPVMGASVDQAMSAAASSETAKSLPPFVYLSPASSKQDKPILPVGVDQVPGKPVWACASGKDSFGTWADLTVGTVTQRFRYIKPGTFIMGSSLEEQKLALANLAQQYPQYAQPGSQYFASEAQREVTLTKGYWMADSDCAQELWGVVMGCNPSKHRGLNRPVDQVSWYDCVEFSRKLGALVPGLCIRLPTEAEWEYACRAGTKTAWSFGDTISSDQVAHNSFNYQYAGQSKGKYFPDAVPLKSLPPNPWGLYEMHGNLWQWCADALGEYESKPQVDPTGGPINNTGYGVWKGGYFGDPAYRCRSALRFGKPYTWVYWYNSFRFVAQP